MRVLRFTAPSVPEAMEQVREQLGPDAVILSTESGGDPTLVQVTAGVETDSFELDLLPDVAEGLRLIDDLGQSLDFHRVPPRLADRLLDLASDAGCDNNLMGLAAAFDAVLQFRKLDGQTTGQPILLAGPPGAGKTATCAKLCAHAQLTGRAPALLTMDTVKAGGTTQIQAYAQALGIDAEAADSVDALTRFVADSPDDTVWIIDTVGANPFDAADQRQVAEAAQATGAQVHLVMPAGGDAVEAGDIACAYAESGATGLIATKLDAARRYGSILSAARAGGLDLLAAGIAPTIGDGLMPLNPVSLARLVLFDQASETTPLATGTLS